MAKKVIPASLKVRLVTVPPGMAAAAPIPGRIILPGTLPGVVGPMLPPLLPPKTVSVSITVAGARLKYTMPRVEVYPGDSVKWVCRTGPFAIHFPGVTPMGLRSFVSGRQGSIVAQVSAAPPVYGCFKYFVAVYNPRTRTVLTDDPDIIVDPKPHGGGRAALCDIIVDPKPKGAPGLLCDIIVDPKPRGGGGKA